MSVRAAPLRDGSARRPLRPVLAHREGARGFSLAIALRTAAELVARVAAGRSLTAEIERRDELLDSRLRAAVLDLSSGALRRYGRSQALVRLLSRSGRPDPCIEAILWCSLFALDSGRYAEYTVVDQAVQACALAGRRWAKGYVNGVLRSYLRDVAALAARLEREIEARYQHPAWWIAEVQRAYPREWESILAAGNAQAPMCLRVNRRRIAPHAYHEKLRAAGLEARPVGEAGLMLHHPVPVGALPGFAQGEVSVQDAGAQRAAGLLDLADGQRVLDACAAPGGKCAHILEDADVALTALDIDDARCARTRANLDRLGLGARVATADCTRLSDWWDGVTFERIVADVPCTGSGVARRHPDIKWLRRRSDLPAFAARQSAILDALWRALAPGGKLLYVTCSVFPGENESVVTALCARTRGAVRLPLPREGAAQLLPCAEHDGFFYALLQKVG